MSGPKLVLDRVGSTVREAGLLVVVFGVLDEHNRAASLDKMNWPLVGILAGLGVACIAIGIALEWLVSSWPEVST